MIKFIEKIKNKIIVEKSLKKSTEQINLQRKNIQKLESMQKDLVDLYILLFHTKKKDNESFRTKMYKKYG